MNKVKKLRKEKEWTQTELANKAKIPLRAVQRVETGEVEILDCRLKTIKAIADAFGVKIEELL